MNNVWICFWLSEHGALWRHWSFCCNGQSRHDAKWLVSRTVWELVHRQAEWLHHCWLLCGRTAGKGKTVWIVPCNVTSIHIKLCTMNVKRNNLFTVWSHILVISVKIKPLNWLVSTMRFTTYQLSADRLLALKWTFLNVVLSFIYVIQHILSEPEEIQTMTGQKLPLKCSVDYISFSAHTDYKQTSEFVRTLKPSHIVSAIMKHLQALSVWADEAKKSRNKSCALMLS